jgi:outer membrane protein assembly factor BamB
VVWKQQLGGEVWAPSRYHGGLLYFGCDNAMFYAFDVSARQAKWQFQTGGKVRSGADITAGVVTFASDDGFLYALDAETGEERWRFELGGSDFERRGPAPDAPYLYDYLHSSPVVDNGVVYIGSSDGNLYAVNHNSGEEEWRFATDSLVRSTPVVHEGKVYFGSWDGKTYAVEVATGKELWQYDCGAVIQSSPAVVDGNIVIGSRSAKIFALDAQTGEPAWILPHEDGSWVESSPVYYDGLVYIGSSDALKLFAIEPDSGLVQWHYKTGGWSWGTPTVSGGVVYIGSISAFPYYFEGIDLKAGFYAIDRETGQELWSLTPEKIEGYVTGGVFSSASIADGMVYVCGLDANLYALSER